MNVRTTALALVLALGAGAAYADPEGGRSMVETSAGTGVYYSGALQAPSSPSLATTRSSAVRSGAETEVAFAPGGALVRPAMARR